MMAENTRLKDLPRAMQAIEAHLNKMYAMVVQQNEQIIKLYNLTHSKNNLSNGLNSQQSLSDPDQNIAGNLSDLTVAEVACEVFEDMPQRESERLTMKSPINGDVLVIGAAGKDLASTSCQIIVDTDSMAAPMATMDGLTRSLDAPQLFDEMPERDLVSSNAKIGSEVDHLGMANQVQQYISSQIPSFITKEHRMAPNFINDKGHRKSIYHDDVVAYGTVVQAARFSGARNQKVHDWRWKQELYPHVIPWRPDSRTTVILADKETSLLLPTSLVFPWCTDSRTPVTSKAPLTFYSYKLFRKVLSAFSGIFCKLFRKVTKTGDSKTLKFIFQDLPGGPEAFELMNRFFYNNGNIQITSINTCLLHLAAQFMAMTASDNSPSGSSSDSFALRLSVDMRSTISMKNTHHPSCWFSDLLVLNVDTLEKALKGMISRKVDHAAISRLLFYFLRHRYLDATTDEKRPTTEIIMGLMYSFDESSFSYKGLFGILRLSSSNNLSKHCRSRLESMVGSQIDQATLDSFLVSAYEGMDILDDVNLVLSFLRYFLQSGGVVQIVRHKGDGTIFTLKGIQMNVQETSRKPILQELKINQASQCPNVVVCYHSFYHNGTNYLVFEYRDRGSLAEIIQVKTIMESYLAVLCKQVSTGLVYLHQERHDIHRILKPPNWLGNHKGEVKITDFGVSAVLASSMSRNGQPDETNSLFHTITNPEGLLPCASLIQNWVPLSIPQEMQVGLESDYGESIDQFFECCDEFRSAQETLGNSRIWHWTNSFPLSVYNTISSGKRSLHENDGVVFGVLSFIFLTFTLGHVKQGRETSCYMSLLRHSVSEAWHRKHQLVGMPDVLKTGNVLGSPSRDQDQTCSGLHELHSLSLNTFRDHDDLPHRSQATRILAVLMSEVVAFYIAWSVNVNQAYFHFDLEGKVKLDGWGNVTILGICIP